MTKKDYQLIADAIKSVKEYELTENKAETLAYLIGYLSNQFINDNPKFNKSTFYNACGLSHLL
jgi:hypothetical protein